MPCLTILHDYRTPVPGKGYDRICGHYALSIQDGIFADDVAEQMSDGAYFGLQDTMPGLPSEGLSYRQAERGIGIRRRRHTKKADRVLMIRATGAGSPQSREPAASVIGS